MHSLLLLFQCSYSSIIFSRAGVEKGGFEGKKTKKKQQQKNELFMQVKSKYAPYKCLIRFSPTSLHMLCHAQQQISNGITKYSLVALYYAIQLLLTEFFFHSKQLQ